jgi:hypothetical protein
MAKTPREGIAARAIAKEKGPKRANPEFLNSNDRRAIEEDNEEVYNIETGTGFRHGLHQMAEKDKLPQGASLPDLRAPSEAARPLGPEVGALPPQPFDDTGVQFNAMVDAQQGRDGDQYDRDQHAKYESQFILDDPRDTDSSTTSTIGPATYARPPHDPDTEDIEWATVQPKRYYTDEGFVTRESAASTAVSKERAKNLTTNMRREGATDEQIAQALVEAGLVPSPQPSAHLEY